MNENASPSNAVTTKAVAPAEDRVTEEALVASAEKMGYERVLEDNETMMGLREVFKEEADKWHMQVAICRLWDEYPELTVTEMAYTIDNWFAKPNYGFSRAKTDLGKYNHKRFACQTETTENEESGRVAA